MKCLLCRISNAHTELMKHRNENNFRILESLWREMGKFIDPVKDTPKLAESILNCVIHKDQEARDQFLDDILPKIKSLSTNGLVVTRPLIPRLSRFCR
jgi:1,2-phenylacetyl-CoA epoxidase catalytic subunit